MGKKEKKKNKQITCIMALYSLEQEIETVSVDLNHRSGVYDASYHNPLRASLRPSTDTPYGSVPESHGLVQS